MDIESASHPTVRQATEPDLLAVLGGDFGASVALVRNYGDRLDATALGADRFRLTYYDAVTGKRHEATAELTLDQVKEAFADYFHGHWHWHGRCSWRTM